MDDYNFTYRDVTCIAVDWENKFFHFRYKDTFWVFPQSGYISQSSDLDHIRLVIDKFLLFMEMNKGQKCRIGVNKMELIVALTLAALLSAAVMIARHQ